ncbi:MAG: hypothetical protein Q7R84_02230 [bacterium]|nr:hypothetical protein [bacterium]
MNKGIKNGSADPCIIKYFHLDVYDVVELPALHTDGQRLVHFLYMGEEHTLPCKYVELILRHEKEG